MCFVTFFLEICNFQFESFNIQVILAIQPKSRIQKLAGPLCSIEYWKVCLSCGLIWVINGSENSSQNRESSIVLQTSYKTATSIFSSHKCNNLIGSCWKDETPLYEQVVRGVHYFWNFVGQLGYQTGGTCQNIVGQVTRNQRFYQLCTINTAERQTQNNP